MTIERIVREIPNLPAIETGTIAEDWEIIEDNKGRVHYKMTKELIPEANIRIISLSVSGPQEDQINFIREVAQDFGRPTIVKELPELPGITFAVWSADSVEIKLASKNN